MIQYKNISFSAKTFYGVKFEPGEIKEVPGYINDSQMIRVFDSSAKKPNFSGYVLADTKKGVAPVRVETRGRKKKSSEPEKVSVAETEEIINLSEEET